MTVDFQPIAVDALANVITQAQFLTDLAPGGDMEHGFKAGTAQSAEVNKVVRQSSIMAAAMANFVSNQLAQDVLDDGDLAGLITKLTNAIATAALNAAWTTGDVKLTMKIVPDAGWLMMNDQTIGDASSGATYANAAAQSLFTLLWTNVSDTWAPVSGGRGISAAADWAAHKRISLTKTLGRALAIAGSGAGLSARALGQTLGEEVHAMLQAEMFAHAHSYRIPRDYGTGSDNISQGGPFQYVWRDDIAGQNVQGSTSTVGSSTPFNVMQPTTFLNAMIKL